ncbi:MAG: hypothetical protein LBI79_08035 [Nitrososphaerota archaeon]|nr:hypothetical protein [Nitrososphaerota archaeon]
MTSDLYSTYLFYLENPKRFRENERNRLFSSLTERFGFKKAVIIFPVAIELPILLFFSVLLLQMLHSYMFPNASNGLVACIMASFGISAVGHLQAAAKNAQCTR